MWRRRLWLLALLTLYPTTDIELLQWFGEIVNIATDVLSEDAADEGQARARSIIDCMVSCDNDEDMIAWDNASRDNDDDAVDHTDNGPQFVSSAIEEIDTDNTKEPVVNAFAALMARDCVGQIDINSLMKEKMQSLRVVSGSDEAFQSFLDACAEFGCRDALIAFLDA